MLRKYLPESVLSNYFVYIYALLDPTTYEPRYIGRSNRPEQRYNQHIRYPEKSQKWDWICSLKERGELPILWVLDEVSYMQMISAEAKWIVEGFSRGWRLTNKMPRSCKDKVKLDQQVATTPSGPPEMNLNQPIISGLTGMEQTAMPYRPVHERGWREQLLPTHPYLNAVEEIIGRHINGAPAKGGILSNVIEIAVSGMYRQWIECRDEYTDELHDWGLQLYRSVISEANHNESRVVYLKIATVEKIDALGDYLSVNKLKTPNLHSPRWEGVYNRKLIIILCLNALSEALKSGVVK